MMRRRLLGIILTAGFVAVAAGALVPGVANAYPQWQFSSGTGRCNQCHFAPAGTGLINNYGREATGEDLSTWQGEGGFLHGAVDMPKWLALGVDLRGAYLRHEAGNPEGALQALFPMQADASIRIAFLDAFSLSATGGYRGQARNSPPLIGEDNYQPLANARFESREHYLMWRPGVLGPYVRAGRFFAPYGLRLAEHTTYVRRDVGNYLLDETYGLSGGVVKNEWELHISAFLPDVVRNYGGREKGVAAMFELRIADSYALGLQARGGQTDDAKRFGGGGFGKAYFGAIKTLLMAELNLIQLQPTSGSSTNQLIAYAGPTIFPYRGFWLSAYAEVNQTDISVRGTATTAVNGQLNWFPYPHFEFIFVGRMQTPNQQESAKTFLAMLHYYL